MSTETQLGRLVVVPSDSIADYERAGYDWLERYYNPGGLFREVFALSPLETGEYKAYGMTIRGVAEGRFRAALRELKPDVVRAYGGYWPADLVCRQRLHTVPVVVSVHDTNPRRLHSSIPFADLVVCMSKVVAEKVQDLGVPPERIRILPNRVDMDVFRPIADPGKWQPIAARFPPGKHILHVGRKTPQKNLDTLIRTLALLPSDYSCIFVGLGDILSFQSLAESLGVSARCFWVDAVKNSELPLWYSWCDCMCTPSRWEGFGIVFLEAAACGAGIVTSDIAPMNEYLEHGVSAHLVKKYEDAGALAEAIRMVCENKEYRRLLSRGALTVAKPFDRSSVDAQEVAIYRESVSLPRRSMKERIRWVKWRVRGELGSRLRPFRSFLRSQWR